MTTYTDRPIADLLKIRQAPGIINHHETIALLALKDDGAMPMSTLGEKVPLSRAAITALTDRLEFLNLVFRTPDPEDRRRTTLALSEHGTEVVDYALAGGYEEADDAAEE